MQGFTVEIMLHCLRSLDRSCDVGGRRSVLFCVFKQDPFDANNNQVDGGLERYVFAQVAK